MTLIIFTPQNGETTYVYARSVPSAGDRVTVRGRPYRVTSVSWGENLTTATVYIEEP